jgi:hypothetical protein
MMAAKKPPEYHNPFGQHMIPAPLSHPQRLLRIISRIAFVNFL